MHVAVPANTDTAVVFKWTDDNGMLVHECNTRTKGWYEALASKSGPSTLGSAWKTTARCVAVVYDRQQRSSPYFCDQIMNVTRHSWNRYPLPLQPPGVKCGLEMTFFTQHFYGIFSRFSYIYIAPPEPPRISTTPKPRAPGTVYLFKK